MKKISIELANKYLRTANNQESPVEVLIDGERRTYEAGYARLFDDQFSAGTYFIRIMGNPNDTIEPLEYIVDVPDQERQDAKKVIEHNMPTGNESVAMLMQMRQMDLDAWERERTILRAEINQLREYYNKMIDLEREKYSQAIKSEKESYDFRLSLVQGNQSKLESERAVMRDTEQKLIRSELQRKMKSSNDDDLSLKDIVSIITPFLQPKHSTQNNDLPTNWNQG